MSDVAILEGEAVFRRPKPFRLAVRIDLPSDPRSQSWRKLVEAFHRTGFKGAGEVIAIVDTGYNPAIGELQKATAAEVDLTGEGIIDRNGHGTLVSMLAQAVAPNAKLIHVKAFTRTGVAAGANSMERERLLAEAIRTAGRMHADVINISAGKSRDEETDGAQRDPASGYCQCPICRAALEAVTSNGTCIVAAAGNVAQGSLGQDLWYCPANAFGVMPVVGLAHDEPIADLSFAATNRIAAAGIISVVNYRHQASGWRVSTSWLWPRLARSLVTGSSFAAPFVSGTAALVREVFKAGGDDLLGLFKRNGINIREDRTVLYAPYKCNLAHFFDGYTLNNALAVAGGFGFDLNLQNLAGKALNEQPTREAVRLNGLLVALRDALYGPDFLQTVWAHFNLALAFARDEEYCFAQEQAEQALRMCDNMVRSEQIDEWRAHIKESLDFWRRGCDSLKEQAWRDPIDLFP